MYYIYYRIVSTLFWAKALYICPFQKGFITAQFFPDFTAIRNGTRSSKPSCHKPPSVCIQLMNISVYHKSRDRIYAFCAIWQAINRYLKGYYTQLVISLTTHFRCIVIYLLQFTTQLINRHIYCKKKSMSISFASSTSIIKLVSLNHYNNSCKLKLINTSIYFFKLLLWKYLQHNHFTLDKTPNHHVEFHTYRQRAERNISKLDSRIIDWNKKINFICVCMTISNQTDWCL